MRPEDKIKDLQRRYDATMSRIEALQIEADKLLIRIRIEKAGL